MIFQNKPHSDKTEFELRNDKQFSEKPANLSKKRKLARTDLNGNLTNLQEEAARNNKISSDHPDYSQKLDSGNFNMQTRHCDTNNFENNEPGKNNDIFVCDENLSNAMLQNQVQNSQDWWQICLYTCLASKAENIIEQSAVKACCRNVIKNDMLLNRAILTNVAWKDSR